MATIKDITSMCKEGRIQEAYNLAKSDFNNNANDVWTQRELGWALYYMIRKSSESGQYEQLLANIDELQTLSLLNYDNDAMIFENVIFWIGYFVKKHLTPTGFDTPTQLSTLFAKLKNYNFKPGKGYTFILESFIKCDAWLELLDFIEWWDLKKLRPEDYLPVEIGNGRSIMSVAERVYIAKSKALIRKNDQGLIEEFLPEMDLLMTSHPEMMYPGYFYGKLLLKLGSTREDALRVLIPFAQKKATEFWVWQLLSDVFTDEPEKQLACLLRAVHCRTQEKFLGKVRIKLAHLFIQRNELHLAKYHIDKVIQCYLSNGWHLPQEIEYWIHQPWINNVMASDICQVDFLSISDSLLLDGTQEMIAIVTYFDSNTRRATLIYDFEKQIREKLRIKVHPGTVLKLNYVEEPNGRIRILHTEKTTLPANFSYAKKVRGKIKKRIEWPYAFLQYNGQKAFIPPFIVNKFDVKEDEEVEGVIVYDYDKKKDKWGWVVLDIKH